ncbi:MAG: glycosyltransferase family 2 protein [Mycobacteriales bacterium]
MSAEVAHPQSLSVVLPAFNEAANIDLAVQRVLEVVGPMVVDLEVVVVDDGSADATAELALDLARRDPRVRLVSHPANYGYGEALRTGFRSATKELVFFTDADNQFDVAELAGFLPHISYADVVVGYRVNRQDPLFRRVNALGWNYLVRALFYVPVRDIDCAFKLFRRSVFDLVDLESVGAMVNTELMVKVGRSGAAVVELGVHHYPRRAGKARGASPRVIATAFIELMRAYRKLHRVGPGDTALPRDTALLRDTARAPEPAPTSAALH